MSRFALWEDGRCGHCGAKCGDKDDENNLPYRLVCPQCSRDGCEECMPFGRGCLCPECENEPDEEVT